MPTWPSTTISTTHLDAGSDRPSLARADLKQMADVVNELVNYGAPVAGNQRFILKHDGTYNDLSGPGRAYLSELYDPDNLTSLSDSNYRFSLGSGTWIMQSALQGFIRSGTSQSAELYSYTDTANITDIESNNVEILTMPTGTFGGINRSSARGSLPFTLTASKTCEIRVSSSTGGAMVTSYIMFVKIA